MRTAPATTSNAWADIVDDIELLLRAGVTAEQIAHRLGMTPGAIGRAAYRHGRGDIGAPFNRVVARDRRHARRCAA